MNLQQIEERIAATTGHLKLLKKLRRQKMKEQQLLEQIGGAAR